MSKRSTHVEIENDGHSEERGKRSSHGDNDSDGDCDCEERRNRSSNDLGGFAKRSVIEEKSVALGELEKMTCIPEAVKKLRLAGICTYKSNANWTLVREFFAGINAYKVDMTDRVMVSTVRGKKIKETPDLLAKFKHIRRPLPTEKQYPYLSGVERPSYQDIWMTLCHESWPPEGEPKIHLNGLKKDFVVLYHIFWWNVYPKPPRRPLDIDQAALLHAVYNGLKPDIDRMWWDNLYAAFTNNHRTASLPLGILLTRFMCAHKISILAGDK
ncbi:hypothetical protein RHMOL_RhmolUnG0005700 [Rhododendron molle]|nr:hypothetical protein RHMOL_RhmolUnG0005700 [Rhododendron molle]